MSKSNRQQGSAKETEKAWNTKFTAEGIQFAAWEWEQELNMH